MKKYFVLIFVGVSFSLLLLSYSVLSLKNIDGESENVSNNDFGIGQGVSLGSKESSDTKQGSNNLDDNVNSDQIMEIVPDNEWSQYMDFENNIQFNYPIGWQIGKNTEGIFIDTGEFPEIQPSISIVIMYFFDSHELLAEGEYNDLQDWLQGESEIYHYTDLEFLSADYVRYKDFNSHLGVDDQFDVIRLDEDSFIKCIYRVETYHPEEVKKLVDSVRYVSQ